MSQFPLTPAQNSIAEAPPNLRLFVSGPAGSGKTTAGVERIRWLLRQGVAGESILVLTPQRTLQEPYLNLLNSPEREAGGEATPATVGGLARRVVDLFWPLAAEAAGFAHPDRPPIFLTLETAQYYMAYLVRPLLEQGYFESVTIDRNRLYAQILDNLNKSAAIGFPHTEIGTRLDAAWYGDPTQRRIYADAQECANHFREYCLQNNLLDFSLQLEIFWQYLWPEEIVRRYLTQTYRHLIYDNVEEDIPRAHDLIRDWLPQFDSALLIYDEGGGYRKFLGADIETGWRLREICDRQVTLAESLVMSTEIARLRENLLDAIQPTGKTIAVHPEQELTIIQTRFYPQLLEAVADETRRLLENGLPPEEIVILSPYLSDALRFSLTNRLAERGVPVRTHRPSRSLRDEPVSQALLTLSALAHPQWGIRPERFDVAYALMQAIENLDLVRAQLLTDIVYRPRDLSLSTFDQIQPNVQARITFLFGGQYTTLRNWIITYRETEPLTLDHFLRKLFGEVLSQPGFGFHSNFDAVRVTASLIESVKKFRQTLEPTHADLGREYINMLQEGVIAAQYLEGWRSEQVKAVLVAPAHTFLMMNRPVSIQFWLDIGASGWTERLAQPLTQPYVLSRHWPPGRVWSDADEVATNTESLSRLVGGLLCRCKQRLYVGLSELGESGFEQRGALVRAFQKVFYV
ncbi:MAG: UvrD-helicase domain-containing protein [Candidatus Villigracilaceae bacterium]